LKKSLLAFTLFLFISPVLHAQVRLSSFLKQELALASSNDQFRVQLVLEQKADLAALKTQVDAKRLPLNERAQLVSQALQLHTKTTQQPVLNQIKAHLLQHPEAASSIKTLWIRNMIVLNASRDLILLLAQNQAIEAIDLDERWKLSPIQLPKMEPASTVKSLGGIEPGLEAIGARFMWNLGYTGRNRIAYTLDTGVWPDHPAIRDRFLYTRYPLAQTWFPYDLPVPGDKSSSHGSHVTGTMMGLDPATADTIGVAFNANFICSDPVVSNLADLKPLTDFIYAFEWAIDPDGDPSTLNDVPDVINNSWGFDPPADTLVCTSVVADVLTAVELAGIANVFAAGNDGPEASTIGTPNYINTGLVNTFTVGALNGNTPSYPIADFSSHGPSVCGGEGSLAIKPEVSAPGVNVRSSVEDGLYASYSGTSMASPHTAGAVLLLKEAFPMATGEEVLLALYYYASDLGDTGEDNTFGMGMINLEATYNYLSQSFSPVPPLSNAWDLASKVISPQAVYSCANAVAPTLRLFNHGQEIITEVTITYGQVGQSDQTFTWTGTLASGQSVDVVLGNITLAENGFTEIWCRTALTNDEVELDRHNNHAMYRFTRRTEETMPFFENFENMTFAGDRWLVENPDGALTWDTLSIEGPNWSTISAHMDLGDYNPKQNQLDGIITPLLSLDNSTSSSSLRFDHFYSLFHPSFADTLSILVSTDCGDSWSVVYNKGGIELSTHPETGSNQLPDSLAQWVTEYVDLSNYGGETILIKFRTMNRKGNHLLVDNILVYSGDEPAGVTETELTNLLLYPNPGQNDYRLKGWNDGMRLDYTVMDAYGRSVKSGMLTSPEISLQGISKGLYFVRLVSEHVDKTLRIVKID